MSGRDLGPLVRGVPDFPTPGVGFKDITPLLADGAALAQAVEGMAAPWRGRIDVVAGIEARGFLLGVPIALSLGVGFVPLRKAGKLPGPVRSVDYALEYGTATLEAHADAFGTGQRVLLVDDVLATGGTAAAAAHLVGDLGGTVGGAAFLIELGFLHGRDLLGAIEASALLRY